MAAHRFWRISSHRANSFIFTDLGEVQFRDAGNVNRIGSGTASASSVNSTNVASRAVDGDIATEWLSLATDGNNGWWQYDFGAGNAWDITSVVITAVNNGDVIYTPLQFQLSYSDDGLLWIDACAAFTASAWTMGASQTFTVGAPINLGWQGFDTFAVSLSSNNTVATAYTSNAGARSRLTNTGKVYCEITLTTAAGGNTGGGISTGTTSFGQLQSNALGGFMFYKGFNPYFNGSTGWMNAFGPVPAGTTVCLAVDIPNMLLWIRQGAGGNWNGIASANPATGTNGFYYAALGSRLVAPTGIAMNGDVVTINTGSSSFVGAVPSGFTAWGSVPNAPIAALSTQFALEEWANGNPAAQLTQVALEEWATQHPPFWTTQVAVEEWTLRAARAPFWATQVAVEEWATITVSTVINLPVGFIPSEETFFPPTLVGSIILRPDFVTEADQIYPPTLIVDLILTPDFVTEPDEIYEPFLLSFAPPIAGGLVAYSALFNVPPGRVRC